MQGIAGRGAWGIGRGTRGGLFAWRVFTFSCGRVKFDTMGYGGNAADSLRCLVGDVRSRWSLFSITRVP